MSQVQQLLAASRSNPNPYYTIELVSSSMKTMKPSSSSTIIRAARAIVEGEKAIAASKSDIAAKHSSALLTIMSVKSCVMFEKNS